MLINEQDIRQYKRLAENIPFADLEPYVQESGQHDIRPFLNSCGNDLWYDMNANSTATRYQNLLNGTTYTNQAGNTVQFNGLKPALVYYAYARYLAAADVQVTRMGIRRKASEHSTPVDDKRLQTLIEQARSMGADYLEQARQFLNHHPADYPLWQGTTNSPKGSIRITAIG